MIKLTIVSGPNKGASYTLKEGETSFGRQEGCSIVLDSKKVSKRHCAIILVGDDIELRDLGSSNGTFINGSLTKFRKLKAGDRLSVGEYVFEISKAAAKKLLSQSSGGMLALGSTAGGGALLMPQTGAIPNQFSSAGSTEDQSSDAPPKELPKKIIWYFERHVMPRLYALNLKYDFKLISSALFGLFILASLFISVSPLLDANHETIVQETLRRAKFMARQISDRNSAFIATGSETKTEIGNIEMEEGVRVATLIDLTNRIISPASRMNQYLTEGEEAKEAVRAARAYNAGKDEGPRRAVNGDIAIWIEPIKVLDAKLGKNVVKAMALVSIDTSIAALGLGEAGVVYSQTLIYTILLGVVILYSIYRLFFKRIEILNEDIDKVLKGDSEKVSQDFRCEEMDPLFTVINSALQRLPKGIGSANTLSAQAYQDDYAGIFQALGDSAKFGVLVFGPDRKIISMNPLFQEISGIRSDQAIGQEVSAVARDQSLGAMTGDLFDRAVQTGTITNDEYDFSGTTFKFFGIAMGGSEPKVFILVALRKVE